MSNSYNTLASLSTRELLENVYVLRISLDIPCLKVLCIFLCNGCWAGLLFSFGKFWQFSTPISNIYRITKPDKWITLAGSTRVLVSSLGGLYASSYQFL